MFLGSVTEALESGWQFHSICPYEGMPPVGIHVKLLGEGYQVSDTEFDNQGNLVPMGAYGLWIRR